MIIRQLKQYQYDILNQSLMQKAHSQPLDASCTVSMTVNDVEYAVKLQPERHCKMAVLQALEIRRTQDGPEFVLITGGRLLSSLLELFICQEVG